MNHTWYEIKIAGLESAPLNVFRQYEKTEMVVGPHTRPSGAHGGAMIESRELAVSFAEALKPVYVRRYGQGAELAVVECSGSCRGKDIQKIRTHSDIIRARLSSKNFVPNKRVIVT